MADDAESVVRKVIEAAKGGDMGAGRLILDRIVPVRRGHSCCLNPLRLEAPEAFPAKRVSAVLDSFCAKPAPRLASAVCSRRVATLPGERAD
jgi:hypothetical protein